jgi:imidazolonepropionase-like amidohydrolase
MNHTLTLALILTATCAFAAEVPKVYAIRGARIHTLEGPVIENGTILMEGGRIKALGASVAIPAGALITEAKGLEAYPGIFDAVSQIGLTEGAGMTTGEDLNELGDQPQLLALTAIHPESIHIGITRAAGITHTSALPGLGSRVALGGQASVVSLNGYTVEQMLDAGAAGLVVNLPQASGRGGGDGGGGARPAADNRAAMDQRLLTLGGWFERARHYEKAVAAGRAERDLALEALVPYLKGEKPVLISANRRREIQQGMDFCAKYGLRMVLLRGGEARLLKDKLAERKIPVILGPAWAVPGAEDAPYDQPMSHAAELHAAGVKVAIASFSTTNSRNVAFEAGVAVAYGLPPEEGLRAVTRNPAEILGLGDRLGTLAPGKTANLILTDGDPLEMRTNIKAVFIHGEPTSLANKQQGLYEKYQVRR